MTREVRFNINEMVRVRLSPEGRLIHRRQHDELRRQYPSIGKYTPPKADAEGYTRWQLWHLMQTFGPSITLGSKPPFEMEMIFEATDAP
jgi:hypothetical protein